MSMLADVDASEVEGASRIRNKAAPVKKTVEETESSPSDKAPEKKSGWGTDANGKSGVAEETTRSDEAYTFDEPGDDEEVATKKDDVDVELSTQIAAPPKNIGLKVQTIRELQTAAKSTLPSTKENGVDVTLLSKVLSSQEEVMEPDEPWEFNTLFVKVTSELQLEFEHEEELRKRRAGGEAEDDVEEGTAPAKPAPGSLKS